MGDGLDTVVGSQEGERTFRINEKSGWLRSFCELTKGETLA